MYVLSRRVIINLLLTDQSFYHRKFEQNILVEIYQMTNISYFDGRTLLIVLVTLKALLRRIRGIRYKFNPLEFT